MYVKNTFTQHIHNNMKNMQTQYKIFYTLALKNTHLIYKDFQHSKNNCKRGKKKRSALMSKTCYKFIGAFERICL